MGAMKGEAGLCHGLWHCAHALAHESDIDMTRESESASESLAVPSNRVQDVAGCLGVRMS